jgi:hypothetical protein
MELTPQVDTTTDLNNDAESAPLAKGQTITFPDGAAPRAAKPGEFRASDDFDNWARTRYQARTVTMDAALKASGLSSPMAGLTDMYESGTFTPCAPYGMCWKPKSAADAEAATLQPQASALETAPGQTASQGKLEIATALQSSGQGSGHTLPASGARNNAKPFQPVTVSTFSFRSPDSCPFGAWTNSRVATAIGQEHVDEARTPDELRELQMRNSNAQTLLSFPVCHYARWVHHGARYRTVIRRKRVHHPVHWVKVGKRTGFVPASPLDKKGQPPANLRHGIYVPSRKDGIDEIEHVDFKPSEKIEMLANTPKEFRVPAQSNFAKAAQPEIRGRPLTETSRDPKLTNAEQSNAKITYDYSKQQFVRGGVAMPGRTSKPVVVSGLNSHGDFSSRESGRSKSTSSYRSSADGGRGSSASRSNGSSAGGSRGGGSESHSAGSESRSSSAASASSTSSGGSRPT